MSDYKVVGQPLPRIDAEDKVRGRAIFGSDVKLSNLAVARLLPSPHAHAEIVSIDTTKAEALPGVRAVITAADIPNVPKYDPLSRAHAFLARGYAVYIGQPVAAVAADDLATAEAALDLIKVEYRPLPAVVAIREAMQPDSPSVAHGQRRDGEVDTGGHTTITDSGAREDDGGNAKSPNIFNRRIFKHGDVAAAFAASDVVVERTYNVPIIHQGYIEPHVAVAHWDATDHVTVWECVQGTFGARDLIANTLGLKLSQITLNATEIGGGFGGKGDGLFAPIVVLLAKKAQRPVRLALTRHEELVTGNPAPLSVIRVRTGAKRDGTLTALEGEFLIDAGAFPSNWIPNVIMHLTGDNYKFQAWHLDGMEVLTNKVSISAYRAPGGINAAFAIESQLDEIARQLGQDPVQLRLNNLALAGDLTIDEAARPIVGSEQVLMALTDHSSWTSATPQRVGADGLLHGRGVAFGSWGGGRGPAAATAFVEGDGSVRVVVGTVDLTGSFTSLAQIAAEALDVPVEQVVISKGSPGQVPFAPISAGSQTIYAMGAAVQQAALDLRAKILDTAAQDLGVDEAALSIDSGKVFVTNKPAESLSFEMLYRLTMNWDEYGPLIGQGSAPLRQSAPGVAACVAEVAVDPDTGQVTLTRLTIAQDVGKAINPLAVEGQLQGGAVQSVGAGLWEEVMYDHQGQVRNPNLLDYRKPTAADLPMIETILVEAPGGDGPYGAKLVGEPPIVPPVAAVANAVSAAIGTCVCELPLTPERVWRAMNSARQS